MAIHHVLVSLNPSHCGFSDSPFPPHSLLKHNSGLQQKVVVLSQFVLTVYRRTTVDANYRRIWYEIILCDLSATRFRREMHRHNSQSHDILLGDASWSA